METALIARVLTQRRALLARDSWTRRQLEVYQAGALRDLRDFALSQSAFYRKFHAGLEHRPLHELPVLTKAQLVDAFDELATDPEVRIADLQAMLPTLKADDRYLGRYRLAATSGTTGKRAVFLWNAEEWATILASYSRPYAWAGVKPSPLQRRKMAVVSSSAGWHQSAVVAASVRSRWLPTLHLDATDPLADICAKLDEFQPEGLVTYASMSGVLAEEKLAGRLHIQPRAVMCASEVITPGARARVKEAFGVEPFDVYGATETATVASECEHHKGMHLYDDLVITEIVDEHGYPVPPGTYGARVLVTVLFSRTLPLIRYEMSDSPAYSTLTCRCGRPFALISGVQGRADETLRLPGASGVEISVHPVVFHKLLETVSGHGWQVVLEDARLRVEVVTDGPLDGAALATSIDVELKRIGVTPPPVVVERVGAIRRGLSGKAPLVRSERKR
jgi:phenylacetate-CoA ligase